MAYSSRDYLDATPFYKSWYKSNWEVLEEDQAGIAQTKTPTDEWGWDASRSDRGMGGNTTGMDKWAYFKARALGSGTYGATWLVYT
jgi:hypothetical protein